MREVGAGFTVLKERPILNENIFYDYQWDKTPLEIPKAPEGIPLDKYIRENTGYKILDDVVAGADDKIKLLGIGLIVIIVVNIFKR